MTIAIIFFIFVFTNSSYSLDQPQSTLVKNTVSVSTDKDSYISNDIIYFSGIVNPVISNQTVKITIRDHANNTIYQTDLPVDNNGHYNGMTITDASVWKNTGLYTIESLYDLSKATSIFVFKMSHSVESFPIHSHTPATSDISQSNSVGTFVLSTNKVDYNINDLVIISGKVNPLDSGSKNIQIIVTDSNFVHVFEDFVSSDYSGRFNSTIDSSKYLIHPGDFIVTATSGSDSVKLKFTINDITPEIYNSIPEFKSFSIEIMLFSLLFVIVISKKIMFKIL
jgi:hypothetical protein